MQGDGAMRLVMGQLNQAREMAVTQRRNMEIKFVGARRQLDSDRPPRSARTGTTTLSSVAFEGNVTYRLISDRHHGHARRRSATASAARLRDGDDLSRSRRDGTLIDQSGNPLNGTDLSRGRQRRAIAARGHDHGRHRPRARLQVDVQQQQRLRLEQGVGHGNNEIRAGFSLVETMFAIGVLSVAALGMAGIFAQGMQKTASSPGELIATQKAAEAIESVFSARDSHSITWAQLRNQTNGGIFNNGPQPLTTDGPDGVVDTADDGPVESVKLPGVDQKLGTADDVTKTLTDFTREIKIDGRLDRPAIDHRDDYLQVGRDHAFVHADRVDFELRVMRGDMRTHTSEAGFSLVELLTATTISLIVIGTAMATFKDAVGDERHRHQPGRRQPEPARRHELPRPRPGVGRTRDSDRRHSDSERRRRRADSPAEPPGNAALLRQHDGDHAARRSRPARVSGRRSTTR